MKDWEEILGLLPHRFPFVLIDRILEYKEGKRIVVLKNVTFNEPFFRVISQEILLCLVSL